MTRSAIAWTFLVWFALLWWQGGFMFYSAIVVHIATDVLGSAFEQGKITARVMLWLNGLGTLFLFIMLADLLLWRWVGGRVRGQWATFAVIAVCQIALWKLREDMVDVVDLSADTIRDRKAFHEMHEWYMRLTTCQWVSSLVYMVWLIARRSPVEPPASARRANGPSG